jgi:hypothetical protein
MYRFICIGLLFAATLVNAQTKKPAPKSKNKTAQADSVKKDSVMIAEEEVQSLPDTFKVYTKKSKTGKERTKLCINLVNGDSIFNHCVNDSLVMDPEVTKVLFEKKNADSSYTLIYVRAFSKIKDRPECSRGGKEIKLFFVRLSNTTNKAIVKQKFIHSCLKSITIISKEPIEDWDQQSVMALTYNRGANFIDLKFDPADYKAGLQSPQDAENKPETRK